RAAISASIGLGACNPGPLSRTIPVPLPARTRNRSPVPSTVSSVRFAVFIVPPPRGTLLRRIRLCRCPTPAPSSANRQHIKWPRRRPGGRERSGLPARAGGMTTARRTGAHRGICYPGAVPAISVLLPVRNACAWLGASLASLRRQSFTDFEIVAVDDGSDDGSGEMLERLAEKERRLRVLHTPPRGLPAALN